MNKLTLTVLLGIIYFVYSKGTCFDHQSKDTCKHYADDTDQHLQCCW